MRNLAKFRENRVLEMQKNRYWRFWGFTSWFSLFFWNRWINSTNACVPRDLDQSSWSTEGALSRTPPKLQPTMISGIYLLF
jgi:hypothetical protein